jgi:Leu/Phe-tRNA-protein transferase
MRQSSVYCLGKPLEKENYKLLDCQVYNPHLEFGLPEIPREEFVNFAAAVA